jgi:pentatricopeptide repeat protein
VDPKTTNALLHTLLRNNLLEDVSHLLSVIEHDAITFNILISHHMNTNEHKKAEQYLTNMLQLGIKPITTTLMSIFSNYMRMGMLDHALQIVHDLNDKYHIHLPEIDDFVTFANVLIRELCKQNRISDALYIFDLLENAKDSKTYSLILDALHKDGQLEKANILLYEWERNDKEEENLKHIFHEFCMHELPATKNMRRAFDRIPDKTEFEYYQMVHAYYVSGMLAQGDILLQQTWLSTG